MKRWIKNSTDLTSDNVIHVTVYLEPEIFDNAPMITGSVHYDKKQKKYYTDINPARQITGPLSDYGKMLEPPIKEEYEHFIEDCIYLIESAGFTIIKHETSTDSMKSEYVLMFGMNDDPCGTLVFDLRISDHPLNATFPEEYKDEALEYLKINKILDESATKAGINFMVQKVTIGIIQVDSWGKAFDRLGEKLDDMRRRIRRELKTKRQNKH